MLGNFSFCKGCSKLEDFNYEYAFQWCKKELTLFSWQINLHIEKK